MNNPKILSVIELQNGYYFVYACNKKSNYKIMDECEIYYDFVKKNKPIKIIEQFEINDDFIIDLTVKSYMHIYGYHYVRGGSYSEENLSKSQEEIIEKELDYIEEIQIIDNDYSMKEIQRYNKYYESIEEIDGLILEVRENLQKYQIEKSRYDTLSPNSYKNVLQNMIPEDFDWLYDMCILSKEISKKDKLDPHSVKNTDYIKKYKNLLNGIKYLYFLSTNTDFFVKYSYIIEEFSIYLKHPEFMFDQFIYHNIDRPIIQLANFCSLLKLLLSTTINRMDEYKHDLFTYHYNIEWVTPRIIYVLEKKKINFMENRIDDVD